MDLEIVQITNSRKDEFWTSENELNLVEKIRSFPALYDSAHEDWKNKSHREDIWEMIASELGCTVDLCKKRYKGLRDKAVRGYRAGKTSRDPAARAMEFILPLAKIRTDPRKPTSDSSFDDSSYISNDGGSFEDNDDVVEVDEEPETYIPVVSKIQTPAFAARMKNNQVSTIVDGTSKSKTDLNSLPRKVYVADYSLKPGESYANNHGNYSRGVSASSGPKSVIIKRTLNFNNQNGGSPVKIGRFDSSNSNNNGGTSSLLDKDVDNHQVSTNFYFGQYVASAIDRLATEEARGEVRQRIQELLFKAQIKYAFNCDSGNPRRNGSSPQEIVILNPKTGREGIMRVNNC